MYFSQYFILEIILFVNGITWIPLYSEFWDWQIIHCDQGDWTNHNAFGCQYGSENDKGYNMEMVCPLANVGIMQKSFLTPNPHYQIQLKGDIYYKSISGANLGSINVDGVPSMYASIVTQTLPIVYIDCLQMNMQTTTFSHIINHNSDKLNLELQSDIIWINNPGFEYQSPTEAVCFRNLDIFMAPCHYSCKTCTGEFNNQCLSCYTGIPNQGICQICPQFMFLNIPQGCVNSCSRLGLSVDQNNVCQFSDRVTVHSIAFVNLDIITVNSEWKLISDSGFDLPLTSIPCENQQFYGSYQHLEKDLLFSSQVIRLKFEIILLFKNWITYSQLQIYFNDKLIGIIQKKKYNYEVLLGQQRSFSITTNCLTQLQVEQIGAEYEIPITQISNKIQIKATQNNWSVRDIYLFQIVCQANCMTCKNDNQCSVCKTSYYNHLGICVTSCPVYSTKVGQNCIDFSEETPTAFYKLKDFIGAQSQVDTSYFILKSNKEFKKGVDYSNLVYQTVFGGPQNWLFETFQNVFYIPEKHYAVRIKMNPMIGDDFRLGSFTIDLNGQMSFYYTLASETNTTQQIWGLPTFNEKVFYIDSYLSHHSDTLTITFTCKGDRNVDQSRAFCALYNYIIVVLACKPFCNFCNSYENCLDYIQVDHFNPITQQCDAGYSKNDITQTCDKIIYPICGNKIVEVGEMCDDGNDIPFDGCHQCQVMCSPLSPYCQMFFDFTCPTGYKLSQYDKLCYSICGDSLVTQDEECDDGNLNPFDGCFNCKFQCDFGCLNCISGQCFLCKDGWYFDVAYGNCQPLCGDDIKQPAEVCDNNQNCFNCNYTCRKNCSICNYGKCLECQIGYYLDIHNQCISKCGDRILTQDEQCENTFLYPFNDECWNCQYQCPENCYICAHNICSQCKNGWILNEQNQCDPICYNKLINRFQCFEHCPENCSQCTETQCLQCNIGFYLDQLNQECRSKCGDTIVAGNEECDDGNLISDDGCNNCRLQCDENCQTCVKTFKTGIVQCVQCRIGWVMNSLFQCEPICGDRIQTYTEVCDDGLWLGLNQRCQSCKYQCPEKCLICSFGNCLECEKGYSYDSSTNYCISICGDALVTQNEECDDANYLEFSAYEGCYQCKFKCQESCSTCIQGICYQCSEGYMLDSSSKCQAICGDGMQVTTEVCESGLYQIDRKCDQCQQSCKENCETCIYGTCIKCKSGYILSDASNSCVSYCGDGIIAGLEECDEESSNCQKCQFKYQESCLFGILGKCLVCQEGWQLKENESLCESVCGDGILTFEEGCDDKISSKWKCENCKKACPDYCKECDYGKCLQCQTGFKLNTEVNECHSICGDRLVVGQEECDDGNEIAFDGCFNCQFQCDFGCLNCISGQCFLCKDGWYFDVAYGTCQPLCGDDIKQPAEVCDNNQNCFNCNYTCHKNCSICNYGKCLECQIGYYLDIHNQCISKCGDRILTQDEQCENTFLYPFNDECWNCQYQCPENCYICAHNICSQCKNGWILNEQNQCDPICYNKLINRFQCFEHCPENCSQCTETQCLQCNIGFYLDQLNQECRSKCGDTIVAGNEECDDGNLISDDGCNNCRLQCDENCQTCVKTFKTGIVQCVQCRIGWVMNSLFQCEPICGDRIQTYTEVCDDGLWLGLNQRCQSCKYQCPEKCLICSFGNCLECEKGYSYDSSTNYCISICGDALVTQNEECDDANYLEFSAYEGCYQCKFKCQESCSTCIQGICYQCSEGYMLDSSSKCQAICGDGMQVTTEVCESGLYQIDRKCDQCQQSCKENCETCIYGTCIKCKSGYILSDASNSCVSYCGDGIIAGLEECDEESSNCQKCQFKYQESCLFGILGKCLVCQEGWQLKENESLCESVCGDGILTFEEGCDDKISSKWKCENCKKACPDYCKECDYGKCLQCETGFKLNTEVNECHSICGDRLVVGQEECDDGNEIAFDGCFNCQFQCDFGCLNCLNGVCEYCAQQSGWVLDEPTGQCDTLCGDGQKAGAEQCDPPGEEKGLCSDCILLCNPLCNICKFGECRGCIEGYWLYEAKNECIKPMQCQAENGYKEVTEIIEGEVIKICKTNCGDGILTPDEECDFGNYPSNLCINCKLKCPNNCLSCTKGACKVCRQSYKLDEKSNQCLVDCANLSSGDCSTVDQSCVQVGEICTIKQYFCEEYNNYDLINLALQGNSPCGDTLEGYKCLQEQNSCRSLTCADLDTCDSTLLTTIGFQSIQNQCQLVIDENMNFQCVERYYQCNLCLSQDCCYDSITGECAWNNDQCEMTKSYGHLDPERVSPYVQFEFIILISSIYLFVL